MTSAPPTFEYIQEETRLLGLLVHHPIWRWLDGLRVCFPDGVVDRLENGIGSLFPGLEGPEGLPTLDVNDRLTALYVVSVAAHILQPTMSTVDMVAWIDEHNEDPHLIVHLLRLAETLGVLSQPAAEAL